MPTAWLPTGAVPAGADHVAGQWVEHGEGGSVVGDLHDDRGEASRFDEGDVVHDPTDRRGLLGGVLVSEPVLLFSVSGFFPPCWPRWFVTHRVTLLADAGVAGTDYQ